MGLAPARIHAQQHRGPVERLGASRPGIDVHDGPQLVLVATQHVAHLEFLDALVELVHLGLGDYPLPDEVGHQLQVLDILAHGVVILDPRLDAGHLAQLFARLVGVLPEVGLLGLLLLVAEVNALLLDSEAALQRRAALFHLLDLFGKYHSSRQNFMFSFREANSRMKSAVPSSPKTVELIDRW